MTDKKKSPSGTVVVVAATAGTIAAMVPAVVDVVQDTGFGSGDLWPFLFWTLPFAITCSALCLFSLGGRRGLLSALAAVGIGLAAATAWTLLAAVLLGPWIRAFGFSVFVCWIAGGITVGIAVRGLRIATISRGVLALQVLAPVLTASIWVTVADQVAVWYRSDQALQVLLLEWDPDPVTPLAIGEEVALELDARQISWLRTVTSNQGHLLGREWSTNGNESSAQIVVVLHRQVERHISFRQPIATRVIHFQAKDGWRSFPPEVPTLDRRLELLPYPQQPDWTLCRIEGARGELTGSTPYLWQ